MNSSNNDNSEAQTFDPDSSDFSENSKAVDIIPKISSLRGLERIAKTKEAVFIILHDDDIDKISQVHDATAAAFKLLREKNKNVTAYFLDRNATGYDEFIKDHSVEVFPSVVLISNMCKVDPISGDINKDRLMSAFVKATLPSSECKPGENSGCCEK